MKGHLMYAAIFLLLAAVVLATLVVLGWTPNTTQSGRTWYPTAPDRRD